MAKLLDKIVVVDVESTCWEGYPPAGQMSEIIEIGVCTIDVATLTPADKRCIFVRPVQSQVSEFCTRLTTITNDQLRDAEPLQAALRILRHDFRSHERLWASWGDYDRRQFERNCAARGLGYPFGIGHLNVKTLFAAGMGLSREVDIDAACGQVGIEMEGTHHRGVDDAWNIAKVLCLLLGKVRGPQ
jgi:inhibitor of KinA sporulation pathway (predicted exonuclease)